MNEKLHQYVEPRVTEARVERLWANVASRSQRSPWLGWRWLPAGCAVLVAAAATWGLLYGYGSPARSTRTVVPLERFEAGVLPMKAQLRDGSSLELGQQSALEVRHDEPTRVALSLTRGRITCDVPHREHRSFSIAAGDVEVRVVGTAFSVTVTPGALPRVEVSVLRGAVEVRSARQPGVSARVAAGESWVQEAGLTAAARPVPSEPAATSSFGPAPTPAPAPPKPDPATPVASALAGVPTARELFERAGERRRAGDAAGAARAYEDLLRLHPEDGRAGLSAFELGRLRMDRLGDPAGALNALERAVALNVGPSFREDALARLVSVYAGQGNLVACKRARARYLAAYSAGVHVAEVTSRCPAEGSR